MFQMNSLLSFWDRILCLYGLSDWFFWWLRQFIMLDYVEMCFG